MLFFVFTLCYQHPIFGSQQKSSNISLFTSKISWFVFANRKEKGSFVTTQKLLRWALLLSLSSDRKTHILAYRMTFYEGSFAKQPFLDRMRNSVVIDIPQRGCHHFWLQDIDASAPGPLQCTCPQLRGSSPNGGETHSSSTGGSSCPDPSNAISTVIVNILGTAAI